METDQPISGEDIVALRAAYRRLEHPGLVDRLTALTGAPLERAAQLLPARWEAVVQEATEAALIKAMRWSAKGVGARPAGGGSDLLLSACSGALGGLGGWATLAAELPVTTTLMLRSIAAIAREEGEDPGEPMTQLACLEVLALGQRSGGTGEAGVTGGYYGLRIALTHHLRKVKLDLLRHGLSAASPALAGLLTAIAHRYGAAVAQKVAAQAVPLLGAAAGAAVNTLFLKHFQALAHAHFTLRRLERTHGEAVVRQLYLEYGRLYTGRVGQ